MSKHSRVTVHRKLDQAIDHIATSIVYLQEEAEKYKDIHPDYYYMFQGIIDLLLEGGKFIQGLKAKI